MLCYLFLFGLALPPFTLADADGATKGKCDKPDVINASSKFFDCMNKQILHSKDKINVECNSLPEDLSNYVAAANKSCYKDTHTKPAEKNGELFLQFLKYSIRNAEFADFVSHQGVDCIVKAAKGPISKCAQAHVPSPTDDKIDIHRKNEKLWKMANLKTDTYSCRLTKSVKLCTMEAMRAQGYSSCKNRNNLLYVSSLFDFMLEQCSAQHPDWNLHTPKNSHSRPVRANNRTTHALLGVLLALAILGVFYVCVRDCRAPRGPWKAINERISMSVMSHRRRSLVNNEVCQPN